MLLLVGTIAFTLSQVVQRQTTQSRGQVQNNVSPTYPEAEAPSLVEKAPTPTIYCLEEYPCAAQDYMISPIPSKKPQTMEQRNSENGQQKRREVFTDKFLYWVSQFIDTVTLNK